MLANGLDEFIESSLNKYVLVRTEAQRKDLKKLLNIYFKFEGSGIDKAKLEMMEEETEAMLEEQKKDKEKKIIEIYNSAVEIMIF